MSAAGLHQRSHIVVLVFLVAAAIPKEASATRSPTRSPTVEGGPAPSFVKVSQGTCESAGFEALDTTEACTEAAEALGLQDTTPKYFQRSNWNYPSKCYYTGENNIYYNQYGSGQCTSYYQCLCRRPTPAPTTSPPTAASPVPVLLGGGAAGALAAALCVCHCRKAARRRRRARARLREIPGDDETAAFRAAIELQAVGAVRDGSDGRAAWLPHGESGGGGFHYPSTAAGINKYAPSAAASSVGGGGAGGAERARLLAVVAADAADGRDSHDDDDDADAGPNHEDTNGEEDGGADAAPDDVLVVV